MNKNLRSIRLVSSLLLVVFCGSCTRDDTAVASPSPTRYELYSGSGRSVTIEWPYGIPDDSTWEDNAAVRTLRAADTALAVAFYSRDWSGSDLDTYVSSDEIERNYNVQREQAATYDDHPEELADTTSISSDGPTPLQIIQVEKTDSGYNIYTCTPADYSSSEDGPDPRAADAIYTSFTLKYESDGNLRLTNRANEEPDPLLNPTETLDSCDLGDLRYGYFTPASDPDSFFSLADLIDPNGDPSNF